MNTPPPGMPTRLPIGAMSDRTGCNIETIRYYERIGLMPRTARSGGGHRLYDEDHVKRLGFIRRSRQLGFTLDQIRTLLGLVDGRRYTCAHVKRVTVEHLEEIRRKMVDLTKIERVLKSMAAECDGGALPKCAVIDALFDQPEDVRLERSGESLVEGERRKGSPGSIRRSRSATE
jgi:MerR family transcriptional regulator, mercuric resistance operon regulatory protein